ncbi:ATP-binding protein [Pedobacter jeongneungensis]|uniref:PAS domain-containing sensor histidine kinase n=1 Tax=Pedobacter jeongneungensis TaxID=947309 RepID=UPI0004681238|nr:ATP-binding protein [Pedobacter jeongneungensis]
MNRDQTDFLQGGGEMGSLIRAYNWESSPLGNPDQWDSALKSMVSMMLSTHFPILICWGTEYIQLYNDAFRPINGTNKHPQALGGSAKDTYAEIWDTIGPMFKKVRKGETYGFPNFIVPLNRNGYIEQCYFDFSYSPIKSSKGIAEGILVICKETTAQVKAINSISEAKAELDFAIEAAELGTWDLNPLTRKFIGNDRLKSWFGLDAAAEIDLSKATDVIADHDRQKVLDAIAKAMDYDSGGHYSIEYHIINPKDDQSRLVRAKGKALFNENRQVTRFSGTLQDITGEHNALSEVKDSNHRLELALEQARLSKMAAKMGTFDMDLKLGTLEWDERCRILFGISHHNTVSYEHDFLRGLYPDDRERVIECIKDVYNKAKTNGDYDIEYRTVGAEDGQIRWVKAQGKAYFDAEAKPIRFIGSVLDITEQKHDELRKNDFIGMVSHELKTPLTSLKAYMQLLPLKIQDIGVAKTIITKVESQIRKMSTLINGFLDVSRLESGKISLEMSHFVLSDLIDEMIADFEMLMATHQIIHHPCTAFEVKADRDKLGSVITNLIGNAIKYSPSGSKIEIRCAKEGNMATVSIKDEGIGIKKEDTQRLFERFFRADNRNTKTISGFGIGLYLSAEIVKRHHGTIEVNSSLNEGSTFIFSVPLG